MKTEYWWAVLAAVLVMALTYFIFLYNQLVSLKHSVSKAWANIDVLIKQRHDELPKLVDTCQRYMQHEQETLERVMLARSAAQQAGQKDDVKSMGGAENAMRASLGQLFALSEDYPELQADVTFQHLQSRITALEEMLADRREFYNESVNIYNVRIEQFPDIVVARLFRYPPATLLEFDVSEMHDHSVKKLFAR